ncbi:MAG TPA: EAL domain-containing protein [Chloroflexota bacterium]|nr:EAL domain-containing protein [Chloroflexota bacterium]
MRHIGLVARFSIVGLTVGMLVAGTMAWFIETQLTDLLLTNVAARASDQVERLGLTGYITAADFTAPYTAERLASISTRLDPVFADLHDEESGVIRLQMFASDGTILYSDVVALRGEKIDLSAEDHIVAALQGRVEQEVSDLDGPENSALKANFDSALEVYVPVDLGGEVKGVYEIYQDLAPVHAVRPVVWGAILSGFALLFAALLFVVQTAAVLIRRQQQTLTHHAFHDALTDLPNRELFLDRLGHALARRAQNPVAVLFLGVDDLKLVNDSLGHAAGDRLVVAVAQRLHGCLLPGDTVARLGGAEFSVLLEDVRDAAAAAVCAEKILASLRAPLVVDERDVFPTASIGIALSTPDARSHETLLGDAETAMARASARGKDRYEVFDGSMAGHAAERLALESDLRRALERGQFRLHYQPILELSTGEVLEVEALVRWAHPERGLLPPADFISVAEDNGLIVPLGQWVLEEACRQAAEWRVQLGDRTPVMGVNLSARQFQRPELLLDIRRALRAARLDPSGLKLEITETVAMHDAESTIDTLQSLKTLGIRLAIDDFGTGYSSLSYLKRFPVDTLKVDKSFVDGLGEDPQDTAIVQSVLALAKALGLSVTGEGIETDLQRRLLRDLGCERGQGYFFARPCPAIELNALLGLGARVPHQRAA